MTTRKHEQQNVTSPETCGRNPQGCGCGASTVSAAKTENVHQTESLMEVVVERQNMIKALQQVKRNKGQGGIDGMSVHQLDEHLKTNWDVIKEQLLDGSYQPQAVLGIQIPKPNGGMRQLGIPTVVDRLIQQAIQQVLTPIFDPGFSESSYGFRPGRSAHQAVLAAKEFANTGKRWVVDMDLEKFFDRVNHDILMSRIARKIKDKRLLRIIRRYLQAGMMQDGLASQRVEGTPQGSPLSPLLSNILLDDLDKELEKRGHKFCRYADDCNIDVGSKAAGERVLERITRYLERKLRLKVNAAKSAVDHPGNRRFLGYSMTKEKTVRLKPSPANVQRLKDTVRDLMRRGKGWTLERIIAKLTPKLRGWGNYFKLSEVKQVFVDLDGWIRRKLRNMIWRQWKKPKTRLRNLKTRGVSKDLARITAWSGHGPWFASGTQAMNFAFPKKFFDDLGLVSLLDMRQSR
ncbi:MAG: group II intron reverse transcriptase/maturase [Planctomycetaceae bacterium]|nr:group II intron reverse transcriptase/maturase [Planctomycetaceae bacterium]